MRPRIDIIAGARPNFMKIAPIITAIKARHREGSTLGYRLVHTGQHYDERMSRDFFTQLGIPEPDVNLEVGSGGGVEASTGQALRQWKKGAIPDLWDVRTGERIAEALERLLCK